MKRKFILHSFLSVLAVYIGTVNVSAQSDSVIVLYTGFQACGGCAVCGSDYWCINTQGSYCGNTPACDTKAFTDPVPAGNIVTGITIEFWSAHCTGGTITASIDGNVFPTVYETSSGCLCSNNPCAITATVDIVFPCGVPGYIYGGTDSIQLCCGPNVCMTRVILRMNYMPSDESVPPPPPGEISGNNAVCPNTVQTYTVPVDSGASTYTWTVPPGWTINSGQGSNSISVTAGAASGNICVTPSNLCGTADTACFNVNASIIQNGLPIFMDGDSLISPFLQPDYWYVTGNAVPIDSGSYYIFFQTGDYYVIGADSSGCIATSDTISVIVTGVNSYAEKQQIKISPNPASEKIKVISNQLPVNSIEIYSFLGEKIYTTSIVKHQTNNYIYISSFPSGVYIVKLKSEKGVAVGKFVKE